jgi:2-phosphosulfolactate phosphatase
LLGFDFGNSPAELGRAEVAGKTLIHDNQWDSWHQRRPRCRLHLRGRLGDGRRDVRAILRNTPAVITLVAMGRSNGTIRADEDELCALYLRACLEGRQPEIINSSGRAIVASSGRYRRTITVRC